MYKSDLVLDETMIIKANRHKGDILKDKKFDCWSNCPFCNDETVNIKLQYVLSVNDIDDEPGPFYEEIHYAYIYKKFQCQICGKELWETWYASIDFYTYFEDDHPEYFDEIGDYTDAYYENRYETYREHFKKVIKTGLLRQLATYMYTVIEPPIDEKKYGSNLTYNDKYSVYKNVDFKPIRRNGK